MNACGVMPPWIPTLNSRRVAWSHRARGAAGSASISATNPRIAVSASSGMIRSPDNSRCVSNPVGPGPVYMLNTVSPSASTNGARSHAAATSISTFRNAVASGRTIVALPFRQPRSEADTAPMIRADVGCPQPIYRLIARAAKKADLRRKTIRIDDDVAPFPALALGIKPRLCLDKHSVRWLGGAKAHVQLLVREGIHRAKTFADTVEPSVHIERLAIRCCPRSHRRLLQRGQYHRLDIEDGVRAIFAVPIKEFSDRGERRRLHFVLQRLILCSEFLALIL